MSETATAKALESDAPLTAAVHQRDVAKEVAEDQNWDRAALVGRTVTINRPRTELYTFYRNFANLAGFMENIDAVTVKDDRLSHWVVKAPGGQTVEWDSEIVDDEPDRLIAWRSVEGADVKNAGRIEFHDAAPGRGVMVTATMAYEPPGGEIGKALAKVFQKEPKMQTRRDLRRFKQLMETGEISTSEAPDAAPRA